MGHILAKDQKGQTVKRFILFGYMTYHPSGGWDDFIASCDTYAEAVALIGLDKNNEYFDIVDIERATATQLLKSSLGDLVPVA